MNKLDSYLYGLILTDGSIYLTTQNRGRITIELKYDDKELLVKLQKYIPTATIRERTRNTNFKQNAHSVLWIEHNKEFRDKFIKYGIPIHDKSVTGTIPKCRYHEADFWRGIIDGNGSVGFTKKNEPFISLVTKSEKLKDDYLDMLSRKFNIVKIINQNKRDHIYNITVKNEDAICVGDFIYENANIYMLRKYDAYSKFNTWHRTTKRMIQKSWSDYELSYITSHTMQDSIITLHRSKSSIKTKLWRLSKVK